ncbi:hypothetical protein P9112_014704 [Eukaryota sp. TZLM1-RC]
MNFDNFSLSFNLNLPTLGQISQVLDTISVEMFKKNSNLLVERSIQWSDNINFSNLNISPCWEFLKTELEVKQPDSDIKSLVDQHSEYLESICKEKCNECGINFPPNSVILSAFVFNKNSSGGYEILVNNDGNLPFLAIEKKLSVDDSNIKFLYDNFISNNGDLTEVFPNNLTNSELIDASIDFFTKSGLNISPIPYSFELGSISSKFVVFVGTAGNQNSKVLKKFKFLNFDEFEHRFYLNFDLLSYFDPCTSLSRDFLTGSRHLSIILDCFLNHPVINQPQPGFYLGLSSLSSDLDSTKVFLDPTNQSLLPNVFVSETIPSIEEVSSAAIDFSEGKLDDGLCTKLGDAINELKEKYKIDGVGALYDWELVNMTASGRSKMMILIFFNPVDSLLPVTESDFALNYLYLIRSFPPNSTNPNFQWFYRAISWFFDGKVPYNDSKNNHYFGGTSRTNVFDASYWEELQDQQWVLKQNDLPVIEEIYSAFDLESLPDFAPVNSSVSLFCEEIVDTILDNVEIEVHRVPEIIFLKDYLNDLIEIIDVVDIVCEEASWITIQEEFSENLVRQDVEAEYLKFSEDYQAETSLDLHQLDLYLPFISQMTEQFNELYSFSFEFLNVLDELETMNTIMELQCSAQRDLEAQVDYERSKIPIKSFNQTNAPIEPVVKLTNVPSSVNISLDDLIRSKSDENSVDQCDVTPIKSANSRKHSSPRKFGNISTKSTLSSPLKSIKVSQQLSREARSTVSVVRRLNRHYSVPSLIESNLIGSDDVIVLEIENSEFEVPMDLLSSSLLVKEYSPKDKILLPTLDKVSVELLLQYLMKTKDQPSLMNFSIDDSHVLEILTASEILRVPELLILSLDGLFSLSVNIDSIISTCLGSFFMSLTVEDWLRYQKIIISPVFDIFWYLRWRKESNSEYHYHENLHRWVYVYSSFRIESILKSKNANQIDRSELHLWSLLSQFVTSLNLDCENITDASIKLITCLDSIKTLNLCASNITDNTLELIKFSFPRLKELNLCLTNVSKPQLNSLQMARKRLSIFV